MNVQTIAHIRSFLITFFSIFGPVILVEGIEPLRSLFDGNIADKAVWIALGVAVFRSVIKTLLQIAFPKMFEYGQKDLPQQD